VDQLTTAEWISSVPETEDFLKVQAACMRCHNFWHLIRDEDDGRPMDRQDIEHGRQVGDSKMSKEKAAEIRRARSKVFRSEFSVPTRQQVTHVDISDYAIRATYREYFPPTKSLIHSISRTWWGTFGLQS